ncbi:MAG: YwqG family protein [Ruminococcus flavefaciens]|nr:YwqG family protein [Ruminococcus flavefaciens]MCM1229001.1 YwqG family protein [Ruminococcus flavefaciens]
MSEKLTLFEQLARDGYTEESEILKESYRNAILLKYSRAEGEIPIGASKLGGYPDLPPEIEYPVMSGITEITNPVMCRLFGEEALINNTHRYEKSAMQLVAQINLYELAESGADVENLLPKKGMLYIFWSDEVFELESSESIEIHCDEPDKTALHKVIYWDGDMSTLKRTAPPFPYYSRYYNPDECFAEHSVEFDYGKEYENSRDNSDLDKIFGYPQGVNPPQIDETEVNLFQSDCYDNFEGWIFHTYWIMKKSDLKNLDFSKVLIDFDMD